MDATESKQQSTVVWTRLYVGDSLVCESEKIKGSFEDVSDFKELAKLKFKEALSGVGAFQLQVFANEDDRRLGHPLDVSHAIANANFTRVAPIVVVAPVLNGACRTVQRGSDSVRLLRPLFRSNSPVAKLFCPSQSTITYAVLSDMFALGFVIVRLCPVARFMFCHQLH